MVLYPPAARRYPTAVLCRAISMGYGVGKRVWPHEVWNFLFREKRRRDGPTLTEFWGPPLDAEEAAMRRVTAG